MRGDERDCVAIDGLCTVWLISLTDKIPITIGQRKLENHLCSPA